MRKEQGFRSVRDSTEIQLNLSDETNCSWIWISWLWFMIKIYDTMSRVLREFVPIEDGKVKMYVCGPTVYNYIHVGMPVQRWLWYHSSLFWVSWLWGCLYFHFTDVDDKIINRAKEEGITPQEVAGQVHRCLSWGCDGLGVKPATRHPRVVEFMADIIRFVEDLIGKGFAYEESRRCLFPCGKSHNYAKLANKTLEDLELGASRSYRWRNGS